MREAFRRFAVAATSASASPAFFTISLAGILLWAASGPLFDFSDTWQLIVNTPTTVLTFLIGILILFDARRQQKESKIVHDELLRSIAEARSRLIKVDELPDDELDEEQRKLKDEA